MANHAGKVIGGRYTLLRQIAIGGMGEVWSARDQVTGKKVAAKVLKPELTGQSVFLARLRMEARNAMQITHPNLASVLDHGEEDGIGWIIMEYVEGRPFNQYLADGNRLSPDQLIPVLTQTAYALAAANNQHVVHRDIKPSNIMITAEGIVKLTDFGISTTPDQATMTEAGMVMGTAQYLPPEQAMGESATHSGDLYALGVIAYEALAGKRPFTGKTQVDVAFAHVNETVPALPDDVPIPLARIVMKLLRKKPSDRPTDATALVRELNAAAKELDLSTTPTPITLPAQPQNDSELTPTSTAPAQRKHATPSRPHNLRRQRAAVPQRRESVADRTSFRHATIDPHRAQRREVGMFAFVIFLISLLLFSLTCFAFNRAMSSYPEPDSRTLCVLQGNLDYHTTMEVPAWSTTSLTA
ncbi:MAG: serine/threonine-protein kinase [Actinomycetaceae bacterium]|nr:serine/threonine-protein kinase [Actinomycetaceae bacterium]